MMANGLDQHAVHVSNQRNHFRNINFFTDNSPVTVNVTSSSGGTGGSNSGPGVSISPSSPNSNTSSSSGGNSAAASVSFDVVITKLQEVNSKGALVYALNTSGNAFISQVCGSE